MAVIPFYTNYLSQWHRSYFVDTLTDIEYNCAEQYMMAHKALVFEDKETYEHIMSIASPAQQKTLGKQVKNFDTDKWNEVARDIVYNGNFFKFTQNSSLLKYLIDTFPNQLVEASPVDTLWGVGLGITDPLVMNPKNWKGKNWLGQVLNKLRDDWIEGSAAPVELDDIMKGKRIFK